MHLGISAPVFPVEAAEETARWADVKTLTSFGSTTGVVAGEVKGDGNGGKLTGVIFWVLFGLCPATAPGPGLAPST